MNDEVRKALDDIRIEIDAMALTLDMDDLESGPDGADAHRIGQSNRGDRR